VRETLFGSISIKFSSSSENIATEALCYILGKSKLAKEFFIKYLEKFTFTTEDSILFKTQVNDENKIPDMIGINASGEKVIIIESKFWAGLTDNQPVEYLKSLPKNNKSILLFLAPSKRLNSLSNELVRRIELNKKNNIRIILNNEEDKAYYINNNQIMALASWRGILTYILHAVELEHQHEIGSDINQLLGLTERMDAEGFLPFESNDLTGKQGKVFRQIVGIIDDTVRKLNKEFANIKIGGYRQAHGPGWYGRYFHLSGYPALLMISSSHWEDYALTPVWLNIFGRDWKSYEPVFDRFQDLILNEPPKAFQVDNTILIPIYLTTGVDREVVMQDLIDQVVRVGDLLV